MTHDAWLSDFENVEPTTADRFQLPVGALVFVMRAFKISVPTGYIYWHSINESDASADHAPFPLGVLNDIVIAGTYEI